MKKDNSKCLHKQPYEIESLVQATIHPCLSHCIGHFAEVVSVSFSPDGQSMVSVGNDQDVIVWDVPTRSIKFRLCSDDSFIRNAFYSPDGRWIAQPGLSVKIWDAVTGRLHRVIGGDPRYETVFHPSGDILQVREDEGRLTVRLRSVETGRVTHMLYTGNDPIFKYVGPMPALSPDGRRLLFQSSDGVVLLDLLAKSARLLTLPDDIRTQGFELVYKSVSIFSPDGCLLAESCDNGLNLWSVSEPHHLSVLPTIWLNNDLVYTPDGSYIAIGAEGEDILVWRVPEGQLTMHITLVGAKIQSLGYSLDGSVIAAGDGNGHVWFIDASSGAILPSHVADVDSAYTAEFAESDSTVATIYQNGQKLTLDARTGTISRSERVDLPQYPENLPTVTSPDGTLVAKPEDNLEAVIVCRADTGEVLHRLVVTDRTGRPDEVCTLSFSLDGRILATGHSGFAAVIWDVTTGELLHHFETQMDFIVSLALSPDATTIATGSAYDPIIQLFDTTSGKVIRQLKGHKNSISSLAYSEDGMRLLSASTDGTVRMWNPRTGKTIWTTYVLHRRRNDKDELLTVTLDDQHCCANPANCPFHDEPCDQGSHCTDQGRIHNTDSSDIV